MKKKIFIIPLVAISLLAIAVFLELFDVNSYITGAQIYDSGQILIDKTNIVIGTYSIRPSFSVELDYDLNVYDRIEAALKRIYSKCTAESDKESCVNNEVLLINIEAASKNSQERLHIGCYEGSDGAFTGFLDYVSNCSSSNENDCQCSHIPGKGTYKLVQNGAEININAQIEGKEYNVVIKNIKLEMPITLVIDKNRENVLAKDNSGALIQDKRFKKADCASYQRKTYTFCYSTGKRLIIADEKNNIIEQEHKIRFALEFP